MQTYYPAPTQKLTNLETSKKQILIWTLTHKKRLRDGLWTPKRDGYVCFKVPLECGTMVSVICLDCTVCESPAQAQQVVISLKWLLTTSDSHYFTCEKVTRKTAAARAPVAGAAYVAPVTPCKRCTHKYMVKFETSACAELAKLVPLNITPNRPGQRNKENNSALANTGAPPSKKARRYSTIWLRLAIYVHVLRGSVFRSLQWVSVFDARSTVSVSTLVPVLAPAPAPATGFVPPEVLSPGMDTGAGAGAGAATHIDCEGSHSGFEGADASADGDLRVFGAAGLEPAADCTLLSPNISQYLNLEADATADGLDGLDGLDRLLSPGGSLPAPRPSPSLLITLDWSNPLSPPLVPLLSPVLVVYLCLCCAQARLTIALHSGPTDRKRRR